MRKVVQTVLFTGLIALSFNAISGDPDYAKIYKKQCATCHGNKGDGRGRAGASLTSKPTDFTSPESKQKLTAQQIKLAIRDGVSGTSMVAYGRRFDEKMLDGLTAYIQTGFMARNLPHPENNERENKKNNEGGESNASNREKRETNKETTQPKVNNDPGRAVYVEHCSACHGDKGESAVWARNGLTPPPRNFTTAEALEELSLERMITSVTYGRPGTAMMSFEKRLSKNEISLVVDFIRQNFMRKSSVTGSALVSTAQHGNVTPASKNPPHAISVDMKARFPTNLTGDVATGKAFYESNCFTCHGIQGDGKGPRAHFNYPKPRNFTTSESRLIFNRPRLFKAISHGKRGSVMPAWAAVLSEQEIANVAEYVFQQFILADNITSLKKKP